MYEENLKYKQNIYLSECLVLTCNTEWILLAQSWRNGCPLWAPIMATKHSETILFQNIFVVLWRSILNSLNPGLCTGPDQWWLELLLQENRSQVSPWSFAAAYWWALVVLNVCCCKQFYSTCILSCNQVIYRRVSQSKCDGYWYLQWLKTHVRIILWVCFLNGW